MNLLTIMSLIIIIIPFLMMMLTHLLAKKILENREKSSPFECGFDPISSSRHFFSLRFFLIAVIFLIFDVEIALILPINIILLYSNIITWTTSSILFIIILLIGLYHEWSQGSLSWAS